MRYVYFAQGREGGPIKIGVSKQPGRRLAQLRSASGLDLVLTRVVAGDYEDERRLHKIFTRNGIRGEWFAPTPALARVAHAIPDPELPNLVIYEDGGLEDDLGDRIHHQLLNTKENAVYLGERYGPKNWVPLCDPFANQVPFPESVD